MFDTDNRLSKSQKRKNTISNLDTQAAHILDQFNRRLRAWALQRKNYHMITTVPSWKDIQAARVLVRMETLDKNELYDLMDKYFENLDDLLTDRAARPTFSHFLDAVKRLL